MARQSRQPLGTGIYHVMMRGINHQNIFEEHEDYYQFLNTLDMMVQSRETGTWPPPVSVPLFLLTLSLHFPDEPK